MHEVAELHLIGSKLYIYSMGDDVFLRAQVPMRLWATNLLTHCCALYMKVNKAN